VVDKKIDQILKKLEKQEIFERENPTKIQQSEKMLAITRNIGLFYNILLRSINAKKILEIGTSTGYSTLWFADALKEKKGANIITIDQNDKKILRAKKNFEEARVSDLIEVRHGDAVEILSKIQNEFNSKEVFDFVFIDADKERYIQYFDMIFPVLKVGGLVGADNILWPEKFSDYIKPYLEHIRKNPKFQTVTIPIDNGEELSLKIGC
jgi:caffeoyl-CoA O-methyltransferase